MILPLIFWILRPFPPRGSYGDWPTWLIVENVFASLLYFVSFLAISLTLSYYWWKKRRQLDKFRWILKLFMGFIFLTSMAHAIDAFVFWYAPYYLTTQVRMAGGLISAAAAIILPKMVKTAMKLKTPTEYQSLLDGRDKMLVALEETNAVLLHQVQELKDTMGRLKHVRNVDRHVSDVNRILSRLENHAQYTVSVVDGHNSDESDASLSSD